MRRTKRTTNRLLLSRETVRVLNQRPLQHVAGGAAGPAPSAECDAPPATWYCTQTCQTCWTCACSIGIQQSNNTRCF